MKDATDKSHFIFIFEKNLDPETTTDYVDQMI